MSLVILSTRTSLFFSSPPVPLTAITCAGATAAAVTAAAVLWARAIAGLGLGYILTGTVNSRYKQLRGTGHRVADNARFLIERDIYNN